MTGYECHHPGNQTKPDGEGGSIDIMLDEDWQGESVRRIYCNKSEKHHQKRDAD